MKISSKKRKLAKIIDKGVKQYPNNEHGDIQLLQASYDYMDTFKQLIPTH